MSVQNEFKAMINNGIMPIMEFQTSEDEFLIVDIMLSDDETVFLFEFDERAFPDSNVCFSGEIEKVLNRYQLEIDNDLGLDSHLQQINNEIIEGFLIPNGLYYHEY